MIYKSSHRLSPTTKVSINGVSIDYNSIMEFSIHLTENEHDYAEILIAGVPADSVTTFFNAAVYLMIDSGIGRQQEFFGYVTGVEPISTTRRGLVNKSYIQEFRIQCLGASMLMKALNSRVWDFPTLDNIVSEITSTYKISASYPLDTFKPTRLTQSNESDWAFLRRVVHRYGYTMSMHGSHLHIWDRFKALRRLPSYHTLITPNVLVDEHPGTIIKFQSQMGQISSKGDDNRLVNTTLDQHGNIVESSSLTSALKDTRAVSSSLFQTPTKEVYQSAEEADRALESQQKGRSLYKAAVDVNAGAGIVPGGMVAIVGYDSEFDGIWYVSNVVHKMGSSMYITELEIHKNNNRSEEEDTVTLNVFKTPPTTILENGVWVANERRVEQYA